MSFYSLYCLKIDILTQLFGSALDDFENTVLGFTSSSKDTESLTLLGLCTNPTPPLSDSFSLIAEHLNNLSMFNLVKICNILSAFRFREIITLQSGLACQIPDSCPKASMFVPAPTLCKMNDTLTVCCQSSHFIPSNILPVLSLYR